MKIECILQRKGGTVVELPGKTYHFAPQEDGKHVADVEVESHIERLLMIPEAYRLLRTAAEQPAVFAPAVESKASAGTTDTLLGSDKHPATFDINGKTYQLGDIVQRAFADSGLDTDAWNELDDETRATKVDIVLDDLQEGMITQDVPAPAQEPAPAPDPAPSPESAPAPEAQPVAQPAAKRSRSKAA